MGLLNYLRGDDLLEDRSTHAPSEARSLPRPDNELPLSGFPTVWSGSTFRTLRPVAALAITAGGAAVRLTRVAPVSGGNRPVASAAGPCLGVRRG